MVEYQFIFKPINTKRNFQKYLKIIQLSEQIKPKKNIRKYGVNHFSQTDEFKQKIKILC